MIMTMFEVTSFFFTWYSFVKNNNTTGHLTGYGNLLMAVGVYVALYLIVGNELHAFRIGVERITNNLTSQVLTIVVVNMLEIMISMVITGQWRFAGNFFCYYGILGLFQIALSMVLIVAMVKIYRKIFPPIDVIEVFGRENGLRKRINIINYKYNITESIYASRYSIEDIMEKIGNHEAVLINDLPSKQKNLLLKQCFALNKRVYVVPKISDVIMKSSETLNLLDTPLFLCRNQEISLSSRILKRTFDIILSSIALVIFSPVFIIISILIKLEDGGPVFFRQARCTIGGRVFWIIKFRSMIVDAESDGKSHPARNNDDRITKVGRVIRPWRIDELPQLINILRGEMSIVGPRPERVEHVEKYTSVIPEFGYRLKMKGGLTGYAQVYGKYNTSALDKLKLDLIYITNYTLRLDVQIIFETIKILFLKESTEGFSSSGVIDEEIEEARVAVEMEK